MRLRFGSGDLGRLSATCRRTSCPPDVTFDESVPYYRLFPYRTAPLPPPPLFLAPGPPLVDPLPPQGPAPSGVSQVDAVEPVEIAVDSSAARGAEPVGAGSGGAEPGGIEPGGAEPGGAESARVASRSPSSRRELLSPQELREWFAQRWSRVAGAGGPPVAPGPGGARTGGTGAVGTRVAAAAARVGPAGASGATGAGATGGVGAGVGAAGASGAAGAGATGGVGAGVGPAGGPAGATGGTGAAGPAGVGAVGAGGAAGTGAATGGLYAVPVGTGDPAQPRPYFVPLLQQVLGLPPSFGPAPPLECPQPVQSQSQLQPVSPLPAPSPYAGPTGGLAERLGHLVFATADSEALTLVKAELQKRHTYTDLGELRSYLGLQITRDRARRTITLTQSHMVHQVLQRFAFQFSSPQPTPLSNGHLLSAPPSDESVEPSGPYLELVSCLITWGMGLVLGGQGSVVFTGHSDTSWADDQATQRSSQGYTFSLGSGSVLWRSTRSSSMLSSSCEAEIYVGVMATQELRWLTYLLTDLGERPCSPPVL
ncbi:unnamed protein product [Closterium sp. NIES-54]